MESLSQKATGGRIQAKGREKKKRKKADSEQAKVLAWHRPVTSKRLQ